MNIYIAAVRGALAGKTIGRVLFNETVRRECASLSGHVLDLAGGKNPSYLPLLPRSIDLVRTDREESAGIEAVDFNEPLPYADGSFDAVLLFSALYIAEDPQALLTEVRRILNPEGTLFIASPFVANEMPEPHDYVRYTSEGLERLCTRAGFVHIEIEHMGERASAAVQLKHPFYFFNIIRALIYPLAILADRLIPHSVRTAHPTPLGYFVRARK
jgi:SAM-dependent methyltransferase